METTLNQFRSRTAVVISLLASLLAIMGLIAPAATAESMRERQWYLDRMQAESMWKVSTGKGITVAVLDGGVDASAPELKGKVLKGKNFVEPSKDARTDPDGHGTAISMLIAGNGDNGQGIKGLAPDARILPLTVFGSTKESGTNSVPGLINAIRYAADSDAQIINMSLAYPYYQLNKSEQGKLQKAVDYAVSRGKLLLAGSGNDGETSNDVTYPAASKGVAGVSAVDSSSTVTKFSNHGSFVALAAPGQDIPIRCIGKAGYCRSWGTSQATAIASGAAALIWAKHPSWNGNQVLRVMMDTAGKPTEGEIPSRYIGYGTIRPRYNVLENKGEPGSADTNPLVPAQADGSPSPSSSQGQSPSPAKGGSSASDTAADSSGDGGSGSGVLPWVLGAVGVLVVVCLALFVVRRRAGSPR
ncbi:type VII secretion-associated serine protease mycosin [Streptomyces luomodiensis]|uniref:Type VII secretion-associated serine protease mycosin n=1 Tax=Streptomyces luomodiensis TaxID=3026192 RepID=A0ABY9VB72_9ACTN|nr:type VII secretion-associated serine protease mycosin [Streptomyces sp. SCA4-21]WNE99219.1 type VII secretion-associated serine protease mycosin [Streptomyces sp. SCA4-21]